MNFIQNPLLFCQEGKKLHSFIHNMKQVFFSFLNAHYRSLWRQKQPGLFCSVRFTMSLSSLEMCLVREDGLPVVSKCTCVNNDRGQGHIVLSWQDFWHYKLHSTWHMVLLLPANMFILWTNIECTTSSHSSNVFLALTWSSWANAKNSWQNFFIILPLLTIKS